MSKVPNNMQWSFNIKGRIRKLEYKCIFKPVIHQQHVVNAIFIIRLFFRWEPNSVETTGTAPPWGEGQTFTSSLPASLTSGRSLEPRVTFLSNDKRRNRKLVQTGFVLIFHCINYKNIRFYYTFAILHWDCRVDVWHLFEKKLVFAAVFFQLSFDFQPIPWEKQR